jgi:hypothetical protein
MKLCLDFASSAFNENPTSTNDNDVFFVSGKDITSGGKVGLSQKAERCCVTSMYDPSQETIEDLSKRCNEFPVEEVSIGGALAVN